MIDKEFTADEILLMIFTSVGFDEQIDIDDIYLFTQLVYENYKKKKNIDCLIGFNIPMKDNYSASLFKEYKINDDKYVYYMIDYHLQKQHLKIDKIFVECLLKGNLNMTDYIKISNKFREKYERKQIVEELNNTKVVSIYNKVKKKVLFLIK